MVVILQQTTDNGRRFVSTVVEETGSYSSNFSLGSQNSISERSAIYKQRIDSLFGRRTRLNSFRPNAAPFSVRIEGSSNPNGSGGSRGHVQSVATNIMGLPIPPPPKFNDSQGLLHSSEDEDYEKITESRTSASVIPDSLNIFRERKAGNPSSAGNHVSSVKLNCEDSDSPHQTTMVYSLNDEGPSSAGTNGGDSGAHMWRNGVYNGGHGHGDEIQQGISRASPGGILKFPVEYLGSVPVEGTTTALHDLQIPLRSLYLNFLSGKNIMSGQLAITSDGLRFEAPRIRLVNPFTTIAVWAAIKFVARGEPFPSECAFMPLISDPEGQDKGRLFSPMDSELAETYLGCLKGSSSEEHCFRNPPIFACVMREASFSLDCHAFACRCAEDAIVVAANLYQSLVDKMRTVNKEGESGYGSLTRNSPATQASASPLSNQKRASSSDSSATSPGEGGLSGSSSSSGNVSTSPTKRDPSAHPHRVVFSDSESIIPVRPPRRKKKHVESGLSPNLKRYNSEDSVLLKMPTRRKSFKGNHRPHYVKNKKRVQITTPEETSSADSVNESIDQVLDRIINPGGMSFNDLKPSYQELILKIALTLTQDQLYQKSKQAMKKQQPLPLRKKPSTKPDGADGPDEHSQFLGNLLKPFSKMASGKVSSSPGKRLGKFGISPLNGNAKQKVPKVILKKPKEEDPFMSFCSGCVCDNCSEKCYCSLPSKHNVKIVGLPQGTPSTAASTCPSEGTTTCKASTTNAEGKKTCGYDTDSCAESEKCYCSLQGVKSNGLKVYNINLDTETSDTDTNSTTCYDLEPFNQHHTHETSASSNLKTVSTRSVEILSYHPAKKLAYSLAGPAPTHLHTTSALVHFEETCPGTSAAERPKTKTKVPGSSKLKNHLTENPSTSSYLNLEPTENSFSRNSPSQRQRNKVLLITGSSPASQVIYKDHPYSFHTRLSDYGGEIVTTGNMNGRLEGKLQRSLGDITEDDDQLEEDEGNTQDTKDEDSEDALEPEKVLSMKKTAEIAAMFNNMRLDKGNRPNYPLHPHPKKIERAQTVAEDSMDFEASLGYLP